MKKIEKKTSGSVIKSERAKQKTEMNKNAGIISRKAHSCTLSRQSYMNTEFGSGLK